MLRFPQRGEKMLLIELIVALLLCAVGLTWLARRWRIPYPIMLTLGGIALSLARHARYHLARCGAARIRFLFP